MAERIFRGFLFWAAGFFRGFSRRIFSRHFVGKSAQKNPPAKSLAKSSKRFTTKSPTHFCRGSAQHVPIVAFAVLNLIVPHIFMIALAPPYACMQAQGSEEVMKQLCHSCQVHLDTPGGLQDDLNSDSRCPLQLQTSLWQHVQARTARCTQPGLSSSDAFVNCDPAAWHKVSRQPKSPRVLKESATGVFGPRAQEPQTVSCWCETLF